MGKIDQEQLFEDIKNLSYRVNSLAGYVQNDIDFMLNHREITKKDISLAIPKTAKDFDNFIRRVEELKQLSCAFLSSFID